MRGEKRSQSQGLGEWVKPTSKSKENIGIITEPSTNTAMSLILLSPNSDEVTIEVFINKAIAQNGLPEKMVVDGSNANRATLHAINIQLWLTDYFILYLIETYSVKYNNNVMGRSHRWVRQKTRQALGWKSVEGATVSLHGREVWTMLKGGQIDVEGDMACERFYALAG